MAVPTPPLDDKSHARVDFVWGNLPLQPDTERTNKLNQALDTHNIAGQGYGGYPGFEQNTGTPLPLKQESTREIEGGYEEGPDDPSTTPDISTPAPGV